MGARHVSEYTTVPRPFLVQRWAVFATRLTSHVGAGVAGAGSGSCPVVTTNAVQNPSFETGDLTDWADVIAENGPAGGFVVTGAASDGTQY